VTDAESTAGSESQQLESKLGTVNHKHYPPPFAVPVKTQTDFMVFPDRGF
jgi:hypothetical protein